MNVLVLSRKKASEYCGLPHKNKVAIISISNPGSDYAFSPFISKDSGVTDILNLCFSDADSPSSRDVYGKEVSALDLMQKEDALRVREFVANHENETIIVHCDAGISRSAGVAAAILKAYNGDDSAIFDNPRYQPNMHCYMTTLRVLYCC